MVCRITTFAFDGIEAKPVDVQVQMTSGLSHFTIVGLPDKAVAESRERVRAAFSSIGLALPPKRIIVNLAPADLPKEGSHYDLAIALAMLAAIGAIADDALMGMAAVGELSLDGSLTHVIGSLPAAMAAEAMNLSLICPHECGPEAAWSGGQVLAAPNLLSLVNHFAGHQVLSPSKAGDLIQNSDHLDLKDVKGQETAKRALEIAAAGGHNLLMNGPPGSGKSMLAQRLPGLLPPLDADELLQVSQIQSLAGILKHGQLSRTRPFRAPHHSASMAALVGGGRRAQPGEASLAHHGVLFLDELPEFWPQALDSLRQPLEEGEILVSRANHHIRYPARFQLVAAMNPCRCGGGLAEANCSKKPRCQISYQNRISGPFLDRIDLFVDVPPVTATDMMLPTPSEGSTEMKQRVARARDIQKVRYRQNLSHTQSQTSECDTLRPVNADAKVSVLETIARPDTTGSALLKKAAESLSLSARAYHRVLKLARTIADLDGSDEVKRHHIAESLSYRQRQIGHITKSHEKLASSTSNNTIPIA